VSNEPNRTIADIIELETPVSSPWFILEVMPKSNAFPLRWVVFLIDVDPDEWCAGLHHSPKMQRLDLGQHKSRADAWECAEQILAHRLATKH
jgi:hypothetical protein